MMALTHGFAALALAVVALPVLGDHVGGPLLLAAAFVGGLAPDADLLASHRKTLHYPVGFSVVALALLGAVALTGWTALVVPTVVAGAAALHAVSDVLGGSAEREPWNPVTDNGVYNHVLGRWHRPRRYVRYSGAPEDFLVCLAFAAVAIGSGLTAPAVDRALIALVAFAGIYALCRKRLAAISTVAGSLVPTRLCAVLPAVRVEESETDGTTVDIRFGR
ncbi:metal-dependent hydrolase [Natrinema sp. 74]|uniref:metal-dependent hydrolase n=1 Tax=Natrinema sp. 74 TaxID=3384159 RepID=UPI0038D46D72